MLVEILFSLCVYGQVPRSASTSDDAARAAAAAEKAAEAAQKAAEAAARAAEAAARATGQAAPSAAPAPVAPPAASKWTGSVGLGLISITGNATALTVNGTG